jgi:EmrB/QacA subfamily drug resistance transporter
MGGADASSDPGGSGWLVEPARPQWVRDRPNAPYYALAAVCLGAFMGQLDASIVTVAFPTLERHFGASVAAVTWVGLSYLIVVVGGVAAVGHLADMVGRKLLYTYGFVVFVIGSGLCAVAPSLVALDAFRAVQGLGAVMLQANSVAIVYLAVPRDRLVRALGVQGAAQALGLALGPTLGGLLLAAGGWRLIFLVNIPAGVLGTVAAWLLVPRSRDLRPREPADWIGLVLMMPAVASLLVALTFGASLGWASAPTVVLFVLASAFAAGLWSWERRAPAPMVDPGLLRAPGFATGVTSAMLAYLVLFGVMFAVPFFLERADGVTAARTGLALGMLPVALGLVSTVVGRISRRWGAGVLTPIGFGVTASALLAVGVARPSIWPLAGGLAVVGAGLGLAIPSNNSTIMGAAPRTLAGVASGVLNTARGLGTALGLALTSLVLGASGVQRGPAASGGFEKSAVILAVLAGFAAAITVAGAGRRSKAESAPRARPNRR